MSVWVEDAGEGVWLTGRGGCDACQRVRAPIVGGQAARGRRKAYVEGDRGGVGGPTLDIHVWFLTVVRFSLSCVRAGRRPWAKGHGVRDRVGVPGRAWRYGWGWVGWSFTGVGLYFVWSASMDSGVCAGPYCSSKVASVCKLRAT